MKQQEISRNRDSSKTCNLVEREKNCSECMRFICDEMLLHLGKWLRVAGYDTLTVQNSMPDRAILDIAIKQQRILITRDKHFTSMQAPEPAVIFLKSNSPQDCIRELNLQLTIQWLYKPFSRCLCCNTLLVECKDKALLKLAPAKVRLRETHFWYCARCHKVYWHGTHTKRMMEQLQQWEKLK